MAAGEYFQQSPHTTQIDEDASLPFSYPSQPPDVRNWFSSYEYESPDCSDTSTMLEDVSKELIIHSAKKDSIPAKEEKQTENGNLSFSKEIVQNKYSLELNHFTAEGRRHSPFDHDSVLKDISQEETIGTNDVGQSKSCPTQKNENSLTLKEETQEILSYGSNQNGISQREEAFTKHGNCHLKSKQTRRRDEEQKENVEMITENGFISLRNRDGVKKHENSSKAQCLIVSMKRSRFELQDDNGVLEKARPLSAGVLAEKTNVCFAKEGIKAEVPGKWLCPRKSKPYAGPPLKQLRLERWMHREV